MSHRSAAFLLFFVNKSFLWAGLIFLNSNPAWSAETEAPIFPKPDPVGTCTEMKLPSAEGQVWRQAVEDWEGARQRLANDPE